MKLNNVKCGEQLKFDRSKVFPPDPPKSKYVVIIGYSYSYEFEYGCRGGFYQYKGDVQK